MAELKIEESEGEIDMCKAIDDMRKESKAEGKTETLNQNIKTMYKNGADENMISKFLELDINFIKNVLAK